MPSVRIGLVGGHVFEMELPDNEAASVEDLITAAWAVPAEAGHLLVHPNDEVTLTVSLRDIVSLEITRPV
jgi:hypothetical protein